MANARSYFDPIAIRFVIPEVEVEAHLNEFIARDFPIDYLPAFLHESSHHFCLNSPLGLAFSLLNLDNRLKISNAIKKGESIDKEVAMIYRYSYTLNLLRPILEGIALFIEHDARTGSSKTLSRQLGFIQFIFGTIRANETYLKYGENGINAFVNQTLDDARLTTKHIDKKSSLFLTPLISATRGGHLLGYLAIKSIFSYCYAMSPSEYTADPDLFVQYFSTYIFEDWKIVELILDDKKDLSTSLNAIIQHLQTILDRFLKQDHTKALIDYQERNKETCSDKFLIELDKLLYRIDLHQIQTDDYSLNGKNLFTSYLRRVMNVKIKDPLKDLASFHRAIIINNQAMCIGNASFRGFKVVKGWIDLVGKNGKSDYQLEIESLLPWNWDGWIHIDLIALPADFRIMVAVIANKKVIHTISVPADGKKAEQLDPLDFLKKHYIFRSLYHLKMDDYNTVTDKLIGDLDMSSLPEVIKIIYYPFLSIFMNPEKETQTISDMERSFAQMLGSFEDCMDVAELTLQISAKIDTKLSNDFISRVLAVNERLKKRFGYNPFLVFPNGRLFSLI